MNVRGGGRGGGVVVKVVYDIHSLIPSLETVGETQY